MSWKVTGSGFQKEVLPCSKNPCGTMHEGEGDPAALKYTWDLALIGHCKVTDTETLPLKEEFIIHSPLVKVHSTPCRATRGSTRVFQEAEGERAGRGPEPLLWLLWEGMGEASLGKLRMT